MVEERILYAAWDLILVPQVGVLTCLVYEYLVQVQNGTNWSSPQGHRICHAKDNMIPD